MAKKTSTSRAIIRFLFLFLHYFTQNGSALKCFEESSTETLKIVNCAYFAFGNSQVCFTRRRDGQDEGSRGCDYLRKLGDSLPPVRNLTSNLTCELQPPSEADLTEVNSDPDADPDDVFELDESTMIEVCVCNEDLCNTYNNATTVQPPPLTTFESASASILASLPILTIMTFFV